MELRGRWREVLVKFICLPAVAQQADGEHHQQADGRAEQLKYLGK